MNYPNIILICDDYGLHPSVNRAAMKTYQNGMLHGVSLIANGDGYDDAIRRLRSMNGVQVGLHFNVIEGAPISNASEISSLLDENGMFLNSVRKFITRAMLGKLCPDEMLTELDAQIFRLRSHGLKVDYFDSHRHLHLFPPVAKILNPALSERKIQHIRFVKPPSFDSTWNVKRLTALLMFRYAHFIYRKKFGNAKYFLGFNHSGNITENLLLSWFRHMDSKEVYEVAFHLGDDNAALENTLQWKKLGYHANWEREFEAVNSPQIMKIVHRTKMS